jgi:hypothetical protein
MTEAEGRKNHILEYEVRGGWWEGLHAVLFYSCLVCAALATVGVARLVTGSLAVFLCFYSIFTIFSSPTFVVIDPPGEGATVERYRYFIPSRKRYGCDRMERIEVEESPQAPSGDEEGGSRRDLSYFVRVYLRLKDGSRLKIFRSGMTGAPYENRQKAFLVTLSAAQALGLPVAYAVRGKGDESSRDRKEP